MWWSIVVILVLAAIVGALVVARRRAALGSSALGPDYTATRRDQATRSDPNTGLGLGQGPGL